MSAEAVILLVGVLGTWALLTGAFLALDRRLAEILAELIRLRRWGQ